MQYLSICIFLLLLHESHQSHAGTPQQQNANLIDDDYPTQSIYYTSNAPFYGDSNKGDFPFTEDNGGETPYAENKETIPQTQFDGEEEDSKYNSQPSEEPKKHHLISDSQKKVKQQMQPSRKSTTKHERNVVKQHDRHQNGNSHSKKSTKKAAGQIALQSDIQSHYTEENVKQDTSQANNYESDIEARNGYENLKHFENTASTSKSEQRGSSNPNVAVEENSPKSKSENNGNSDYENARSNPDTEKSSYEQAVNNYEPQQRNQAPAMSTEQVGEIQNNENSKNFEQRGDGYGEKQNTYGNSTDNYDSRSSVTASAGDQVKDTGYGAYSSEASIVEADKQQLQHVSEFYGDQIIPGDIPNESEIARRMSVQEQPITVDQYPVEKNFSPESVQTETGSTRHRIYSKKQQLLMKKKKRLHVKNINNNKAIDKHVSSKAEQARSKKHGKAKSFKGNTTESVEVESNAGNKKPKVDDENAVGSSVKISGKKQRNVFTTSHLKTIPANVGKPLSKKAPKMKKSGKLHQTKSVTKKQQSKHENKPAVKIVKNHPKVKSKNPKVKSAVHAQIKPINATTTSENMEIKSETKESSQKNDIATQRSLKATSANVKSVPQTKANKPPQQAKEIKTAGKTVPAKTPPKKTAKVGEKNKTPANGGKCTGYLGCLEKWFQKYSVSLTPMDSMSQLEDFFKEIYKSQYMASFKSEVKNIVQKLSAMRLINWAITYDYRPKLASWMNIEFLRMPLGTETPANLKQHVVFNRILALKEKQDTLKQKVRTLKNVAAMKRSMATKIQTQVSVSLEEYQFLEQSLEDLRDNATITEIYKDEAPALSVSGYDRNSYVWSRCAPKDEQANGNIFSGMYQKQMNMNSYQCVLYAFMKCVRDMEKEDRYQVENKKRQGSFERYQNGFESLIQLHYDYGAKQNKLVPIEKNSSFSLERLTSAYCESPAEATCLQEDGVSTEAALKFGDSYYCQNYFGCHVTCGENCFLRERNLLPDERDRLITWLSSREQVTRRKAATELWDECCSNVQNCLPLRPPFQL